VTRLALAVTLLNLLLLVPGVTLPIYSVTITTQVEASIIPDVVEVTVYEQTRSILGTVAELWRSADYLVSFLILLFSIIVPVTKVSTLVASMFVARDVVRRRLVFLVDLIGKWSMADVFVVAVFLAFLATRDQAQTNSFSVPVLLAQVDVGMETHLTSTLEPGFYYFLTYCLFSVFWTQVLKHRSRV
jgi:paraquat-inducible protein A